MKISDAILILNIQNYNITNIQHISYNELKKHYHIQALLYHPDKNSNTENSTLIFQNINCAFSMLKGLISNPDLSTYDLSGDDLSGDDLSNENTNYSYNNLLISFINYIIKYYNNNNNVSNVEADKQLTIFIETLFSKLSLIILEDIYLLLTKFNTSLLLTNKIVSILKKLITSILEKNSIYIINPTISNLLNSDIYKLTITNEYVYVPLWHNELSFENAIIKIYPLLPSNVSLDGSNIIHYTYKNKFNTLLEIIANNVNSLIITIDNNDFSININNLKLTKYQTYTLENQGIPNINSNNILDNSIKSDIVFHIHLE
jgi:curved DNA-binding protein CbpA